MKGRLRIAVVGYGTGGQAAALMLSGDGHEVEVFEQAPRLGPVGAGFLLQPVGQWVLWELGLLDAVHRHAVPISRLYGETAAGRPVMDMRYAELDPRLCGLGMQRAALFSVLDTAWTLGRTLHCGVRIVQVDTEQGVLFDELGRRHAGFDLILVADGAASVLRAQVSTARVDRPIRGARSGVWFPPATGRGAMSCSSATWVPVAWRACCRWGRGRAIRCRA